MSYKLLSQGYTADEVKLIKKKQGGENHALEQLRKWKESEHVLNILRTIKASEKEFTKLEMEAWRKATMRR